MNRQEALEHFQTNYVDKCAIEHIYALDQYFRANKDNLAADLLHSFRQLCAAIKQQDKNPIAFINLYMLRTALSTDSHTCRWEAYDSNWYLDPQPCLHPYEASWAFSYLDKLIEELDNHRREYMGILIPPDLEKIRMQEAPSFYQYVINLARYTLTEAINSEEYQAITKEPELHIMAGEYQDTYEIIYTHEQNPKNSFKIKHWLEKREKTSYRYETLENLNLTTGNYQQLDLCYTHFDNSNLSQSDLSQSALLSCTFKNSDLQRTDLNSALIYDADFSHSNLSQADLSYTEGADGIGQDKIPSFFGVNFTGSNLTGANLTKADLRGADFQKATIQNTNFQDTQLEGALFDQKEQNNPCLSPEQKQTVKWQGDAYE